MILKIKKAFTENHERKSTHYVELLLENDEIVKFSSIAKGCGVVYSNNSNSYKPVFDSDYALIAIDQNFI